MYQIHLVTPVASRDYALARQCAASVEAASYFLRDSTSLSQITAPLQWHVVCDGFDPQVIRPLLPLDQAHLKIHLSRTTTRVGPGVARNAVLSQLDGGLAAFIDVDDFLYPWGLAERLRTYIAMNEQITGYHFLVYGQVVLRFQHPNGQTLQSVRPIPSTGQLVELLQENNVLIPDMVLTPVEVICNAGGFEPHLVCGEDGNLWRRLVGTEGVRPVSLQLPIVIYESHENSQSKIATSDPKRAEFNDDAFHLSPEKHGPMGQHLDHLATARGKRFLEATTDEGRMNALAPGCILRRT